MAGYDKSKSTDYTLAVQSALRTLGADLGRAGVDGKWGEYTQAAYEKNRDAVDRLVGQMGVETGNRRLSASQVEVPETRGFEEWLTLGSALYEAQAEAQKAAAKRQLERNQAEVEEGRVRSAAALENAANARGFGRSSYATDMLQRNEYDARQSQTDLLNSFSDALLQIDANRATNAAQFAASMTQSENEAASEAQKLNAQLRQEAEIAQWKQDQADRAAQTAGAASSASRRSSGRSTSKEKKTSSGVSALVKSGIRAIRGIR